MADKLDWLNEHFVLQNNLTVSEVIEKQNYKLPFELREIALKYPMSEDFVKALVSQGKFKQASEFLAYNLHRRALAWWGYCVVLSLTKELHDSPAKERDISEIGKPKKLEVPDWAKEIPSDEKSFAEKFEEELAKLEKTKETALKKAEESLEKAGPEAKAIFYEAKKMVWDLFKKEVGMDPDEFMNKTIADALEYSKTHTDFDETKTPIYKASQELKEKIEKMRQETIETIKMAVPIKSQDELKEQKKAAMDAAYSFIVAPNEHNAKLCLDIGNSCPDVPEGLLCLVCFWSFGNLTPGAEQVVKTPAGLASNGMNSLLLMCSLAQGGNRKFAQRTELYYLIGQEIGFGINNFSDHVALREMPHHILFNPGSFDGYLRGLRKEKISDDNPHKSAADSEKTPNTATFTRFKA